MKSLHRSRTLEPHGSMWPDPAQSCAGDETAAAAFARPLAPARWDWGEVERVLVVRLRSIGDTVLATPSLHALRRFLPHARIDVLLENWVAPVLDGFQEIDNIITVERA